MRNSIIGAVLVGLAAWTSPAAATFTSAITRTDFMEGGFSGMTFLRLTFEPSQQSAVDGSVDGIIWFGDLAATRVSSHWPYFADVIPHTYDISESGQYLATIQAVANYTFLVETNSGPIYLPVTERYDQVFRIFVNNVAPTVGIGGPQVIEQGQPVSLTSTFYDPGKLDMARGPINPIWTIRDALNEVVLSLSGTTINSPLDLEPGDYSVSYSAYDRDGGQGIARTTMTVTAAHVPEPSTLPLFGMAFGVAAIASRYKRG